jgi:hypothetical protein
MYYSLAADLSGSYTSVSWTSMQMQNTTLDQVPGEQGTNQNIRKDSNLRTPSSH